MSRMLALRCTSKKRLDRLPPPDHALVVLTGFVATLERWLSVFKDGHIMGLRLVDKNNAPPW